MKPSKLLFGAAGFTIASSALFMGAGVASVETTPASSTDAIDICTTECEPSFVTPIIKIEGVLIKFDEARPASFALQKVLSKLELIFVLDKI